MTEESRASAYGDAFADVYDEWYGDVSDVEATVDGVLRIWREAGASGPVLELGIGTGRLALPLSAAGVAVYGVDASEAMVERLRAKPGGERIDVLIGDMASRDLGTWPGRPPLQFAVVFAAFNTFCNIRTEAQQRQCLALVAAALRPGGRFALESVILGESAGEAEAGTVEVRNVSDASVVLTVSRRIAGEPAVSGQHVELTPAGVRLRPWYVRCPDPEDLDALARSVGLVLIDRWADWRGRAWTGDEPQHVSLYGRDPNSPDGL